MELFVEIENSFPAIQKLMNDEIEANFLLCKFENLGRYRFILGLWIRNNLLMENSKLYKLFINGGVDNKEQMSALMIQLFYIYLRNKQG